MKKILITRIAEEAHVYAEELENQGFSVLSAPMLSIEPIKNSVPDISAFDGFIFTSAQAVRFFECSDDIYHMPVFCVGVRTEAALREKGFLNIYNANGTAIDIVPLVRASGESHKRFLHVCGENIARDIQPELEGLGKTLERLIVYKAEPVCYFDPVILNALGKNEIKAVLFFSKRTLENFQYLAEEKGFSKHLKFCTALCISENVAAYVQAEHWGGVRFTSEPNRSQMLTLLKNWEQEI